MGKRPAYTSPSYGRGYGQSSGSADKRPRYEKKPNPPVQSRKASKAEASEPTPECRRCYGPHDVSACKWTPGACYSCGQVGHKSSECKNPILKPIFCFNYTQRGHSVNQCKEAPRSKIGGNGSRKKSAARVFALQLEEAPSVDAFAGNMLISSHVAYVLVDTGAHMHAFLRSLCLYVNCLLM